MLWRNRASFVRLAHRVVAIVAVLGAFPGATLAAEKSNQISLSASAFDGRFGVSGNYTRALSGSFRTEGFLVRFGAGVGGDVDDGDESGGGSRTLEALVGYQFVSDSWRLRAFAGGILRDDDDGSELGYKLYLTAFNKPSDPLYVSASLSYTSPRQYLSGSLRLGKEIGTLVVGPEFSALFAPTFTRTRLGVFVSGLDIGSIGVTLRGGYTDWTSSGDKRASGYVGVSGSLQY